MNKSSGVYCEILKILENFSIFTPHKKSPITYLEEVQLKTEMKSRERNDQPAFFLTHLIHSSKRKMPLKKYSLHTYTRCGYNTTKT